MVLIVESAAERSWMPAGWRRPRCLTASERVDWRSIGQCPALRTTSRQPAGVGTASFTHLKDIRCRLDISAGGPATPGAVGRRIAGFPASALSSIIDEEATT